jgi:hypothetical protein
MIIFVSKYLIASKVFFKSWCLKKEIENHSLPFQTQQTTKSLFVSKIRARKGNHPFFKESQKSNASQIE